MSADNAVDAHFAPEFPIELVIRSKCKLERQLRKEIELIINFNSTF